MKIPAFFLMNQRIKYYRVYSTKPANRFFLILGEEIPYPLYANLRRTPKIKKQGWERGIRGTNNKTQPCQYANIKTVLKTFLSML
jgi:hypothetical protein